MAITELLRFLVTAETADAQAKFKALSGQVTKTSSALDKLGGSFKAGLGVGVGAATPLIAFEALRVAITGVANAYKAAVNAASELQASQATVKAIFGSSSAVISAAAKDAAQTIGVSEAAYARSTAVMGALLQNLGYSARTAASETKRLVAVGADLGATYGTDTADAVMRLGAVLRGEFDSVERLGIKIRQTDVDARVAAMGLDTSTVAAKSNAQAQAALSLIYEQSKNQMGQFAARSGTLAVEQQKLNAEWENAKARIGEELLPLAIELVETFEKGIPAVEAFAKGISTIGKPVEYAAKGLNAAADAVKGLFSADETKKLDNYRKVLEERFDIKFGGDADKVRQYVKAWTDGVVTSAQLKIIADSTLPAVTEAFKNSGFAAAAYNAELQTTIGLMDGLGSRIFSVKQAEEGFWKAIDRTGNAASSSGNKVEKSYRAIDDAQRRVADSQERLNEALIERFLLALGPSADEITREQIKQRDAIRDVARAQREVIAAERELQELREGNRADLLDAEADYIEAQRRFAEEGRYRNDAVEMKRAEAQLIRTKQAFDEARDPTLTNKFQLAEENLSETRDRLTEAQLDEIDALRELNELMARGTDGSKEMAAANRKVYDAQRDLEDSEYGLRDAHDQLEVSTSKLAGSTKTANDAFWAGIGAVEDWRSKVDFSKMAPEQMAGKINEMYGALLGVAEETGDPTKIQDLKDYFKVIADGAAAIQTLNNQKRPGLYTGIATPEMYDQIAADVAAAGAPQQVKATMTVDGRAFGFIVVDALRSYQLSNGPIPIAVNG